MGQKVNPTGLRAGINLKWPSRWFANKHTFGDFMGEDIKIRKFFEDKFNDAGIASVEIERDSKDLRIILISSKRGVILGKDGSGSTKLEAELRKIIRKKVSIEVKEVSQPDTNGTIVAEQVWNRLENILPAQ